MHYNQYCIVGRLGREFEEFFTLRTFGGKKWRMNRSCKKAIDGSILILVWQITDHLPNFPAIHWLSGIGGGIRGPWPLLNLRPFHRIVIFAIEDHFSLANWPPLLSVASSASVVWVICTGY